MIKILRYESFIKESISFKYNHMIDYTLLDNSASDDQIKELCKKAVKYGVFSVCVMPKHVKLSSSLLKDSGVLVCTVVSFPDGTNSIKEKVYETKQVIINGADEIDMVLDWKSLKDGIYTNEIESVRNVCKDKTLKVIVESGNLSIDDTRKATELCIKAGADFIKTSTGKTPIGAEPSKVKAMNQIIDSNKSSMNIKASGGVRTISDIEEYLKLGATRFGMGYGSVDLLNGGESKNTQY